MATKINAVKFKNDKSFEKNKAKANVLQVHEPFKILVFEDKTPVTPDPNKVKHVKELPDMTHLSSGLAIATTKNHGAARTFLKDHNVDIIHDFEMSKSMIIDIPDNTLFSDFHNLLISSGLFSTVEEDMISEQKSSITNYPYTSLWHLGNVKASQAWAMIPAGPNFVDVAVLEGGGAETTHPDLIGKFNLNWNCVTNTGNVEPASDYEKHGTCVAGIINANCANNQWVMSMGNDRVRVQYLTIGYNAQADGTFSTSDSIKTLAVNKAMANPNCVALSMSFGGGTMGTNFGNALTVAQTTGRGGKGICIFASSGNSSSPSFNQYPAAHPAVMAIGATGSTNVRASYSNYGTKLFAAAPGSIIYTTDRTGGKGYSVNTDAFYEATFGFSGTSAACPVFAGAVAMMMLANPSLTETQIRTILAATCRKLGGYTYTNGKSLELGYGIIDMEAAVAAALGSPLPPPAPVPDLTLTLSAAQTAISGTIIPITYSVTSSIAMSTNMTFNTAIYYSLDASISSTDTLVMTIPITISANQLVSSGTFNFTVPANVMGNIYLIGNVDSGASISETNEANNVATAQIFVTAPVAPNPVPTGLDLGVQLLSYDYTSYGMIRFTYKFTNHGSTTITNFSYVRGYIGGTQMTTNLNYTLYAGGTATLSTVWYNTPPSYPATYMITITGVNGGQDYVASNNVSTITVNQP